MSKQLLLKAIAGLTGMATLGLTFAGGEYAPAPTPTVAPTTEEAKGFYVGVNAGYADNHWNKSKCLEISKRSLYDIKHTGFAGGLKIGYAINRFIGIEGGYTYLPNAKVTFKNLATINNPALNNGSISQVINPNLNDIEALNRQVKVKNHAFDIAAKVTLPIPAVENVGIYGKAGVGFLNSKLTTSVWANTNAQPGEWSRQDIKTTERVAKLTYGAGAYWDVTTNIRLDAGWQRFQGKNKGECAKLKNRPNIDTFMVGVSYFLNNNELFNS